MNERTQKPVHEVKVESNRKAPKGETKGFTPLKPEEQRQIVGGACALLRRPPYYRCW